MNTRDENVKCEKTQNKDPKNMNSSLMTCEMLKLAASLMRMLANHGFFIPFEKFCSLSLSVRKDHLTVKKHETEKFC